MTSLDEIRQIGIVEARRLKLEDVLQAAFDGVTYVVWKAQEQDKFGNWTRQAYEVHNEADGNLLDACETRWTYHDAAKGSVSEITVDRGIGVKDRLVIAHDEEGKVTSARRAVIMPEPDPIEKLTDEILQKVGR
jgi:hypothetical protein